MFDMQAISALSGQTLLLRLVAALLIAITHGMATALLAGWMGDKGPRYDGRLSLNPFVQLDAFGLFSQVLFRIGWSKPVEVDPTALKGGRWGLAVVILGGLLGVLVLGMAGWWLRPVAVGLLGGGSEAVVLSGFLEILAEMSVWFALGNLVPLPPFAAGSIWRGLMPAWDERLRRRFYLAGLVMLVIVASSIPGRWLAPVAEAVQRLILL